MQLTCCNTGQIFINYCILADVSDVERPVTCKRLLVGTQLLGARTERLNNNSSTRKCPLNGSQLQDI